jgi:energy-coupling factor transporter ATP-binding protein EcfA2
VFGPARLTDAWAFLEWRATEDLLLDRGGDVFLHAAGARLGARHVLIIGPSGSGKSTLATHLLAAGNRVWGDDLVRFAVEQPHFAAAPRSFKLDAKALSDIPLVGSLCAASNAGTFAAPGCCYVSPAAVRSDWQADPGPADVVILLERSAGRAPDVRAMSSGEAAVHVAASVLGVRHGGRWPAVVDAVLRALQGAEAVRAAGSPARALAERIERECAA